MVDKMVSDKESCEEKYKGRERDVGGWGQFLFIDFVLHVALNLWRMGQLKQV